MSFLLDPDFFLRGRWGGREGKGEGEGEGEGVQLSPECAAVLGRMLDIDPARRATISECNPPHRRHTVLHTHQPAGEEHPSLIQGHGP